MNQLPANGSMDGFLSKNVLGKRSQDLPKYYRLNGAIYICARQRFLQEQTFLLENSIFAYKMQPMESIDIDTMVDLVVCKSILEMLEKKG